MSFISSIMRFPNYKFSGPFYLYNKHDIIFLTVFILTHPACQLFLWDETGAPGENTRPSADRWQTLHMHESRARVEPMISEVKGACSDDCATEAPHERISKRICIIKQVYEIFSSKCVSSYLNRNFCVSFRHSIILTCPFHVFVPEPILSEGFPDFVILDDGWTCVSRDGSRLVDV